MRATWFGKSISADFMLHGAGVALAVCSVVFAMHQLSKSTEPQITGLEHLAIYAKPANRVVPSVQRERSIDYTPVGSTHAPASSALLGAYEIIEASGDSALVRLPEGRIQRVAPGGRIAGLGAVSAIRRSAQKWLVITQAGVIRQN